ncbi:insulin-like 3 (Leydig cell) isoform X2 [Perca flavescens]|uniref:insulin-like 3 (Leydig cell) isoform X2 n=1 Tax=Perca flavescens TaxID=8167 RepID=UPI00106EBDA3|nr:uncharacterized protein LOC114565727 isoform X2 [Perca flavescens]
MDRNRCSQEGHRAKDSTVISGCTDSFENTLTNSNNHRTMTAARSLVPLMVVLVAAVGEARAQDRIKICGRDLIRLAVTSCGNSRVRRSILDADLAQRQYASHCVHLPLHRGPGCLRRGAPGYGGSPHPSRIRRGEGCLLLGSSLVHPALSD